VDLLLKTKIVSSNTADSKTDQYKPVKQEVNCTVILPPLVFPGWKFSFNMHHLFTTRYIRNPLNYR
jgi:hypothetical protein